MAFRSVSSLCAQVVVHRSAACLLEHDAWCEAEARRSQRAVRSRQFRFGADKEPDHALFSDHLYPKDNLAAVANYRPVPYTGSIDLFQPEESPVEVQQLLHTELCAFAAGPLRLHPIPGDHYSILRAPLVDNTARAIDDALTSIARSSKSSNEAVAVSV